MTDYVILGGGMAGMTAAYELAKTNPADQIDLYQLGWRVGGKLATGRYPHPDTYNRIEEHGIHVLFGAYENVFYILREIFDNEVPDPNWEDRFHQRTQFTLREEIDGEWKQWDLDFPVLAGRPGDEVQAGNNIKGIPDFIRDAIAWIILRIAAHFGGPGTVVKWFLEHYYSAAMDAVGAAVDVVLNHLDTALNILNFVYKVAHWIYSLLSFLPYFADKADKIRRLWIVVELATTAVRGTLIMADAGEQFSDIDHLEFREWLDNSSTDGALTEVTRNSSALEMLYELAFAYEDGDFGQPVIAAGSAVKALLRLFLDYKGSFVWAMRDGSETVVTPVYKALVALPNVNIHFFHRVTDLRAMGGEISEINLLLEAQVLTPPYDPFADPLVPEGGWGAIPHYEQLVDTGLDSGTEFGGGRPGIDLEYDDHQPVASTPITLEKGAHFDNVILALPPLEVARVTTSLTVAPWPNMVSNFRTNSTIAVQLWLTKTPEQLGWHYEQPIMGTYAEPLPDWIDLSETIQSEKWPIPAPASVAYLCGVAPDWVGARDPAAERQQVRDWTHQWLLNNWKTIWPGANDETDNFDWSVIYDPSGGVGEDRLNRQFFRYNIDRGERYTLSLPDTMTTRLRADGSPYTNMIICGDWIDNGLNLGCVEAAVMSGRQAARTAAGLGAAGVYGDVIPP